MDDAKEIEAVKVTVNKYINGIKETKPDLVVAAFHPDAMMTRTAEGDVTFTKNVGPYIADFMKKFPPTSEHSPNFEGRIVDVRVHGTIASVEIAEDQLTGKDMKTFFQLHKGSGGWLITAKATWAPE